MSNKLEIIPLGGIGEFGMNCMAVRYADEMIVIDAGMGFPEESAYGVDVAVPDFSFLEPYRGDITALILTHGHEDHIGALPYFLKRFNVPIYTSHFTAAMAENKLHEHNLLDDILLHRMRPRDTAEIGSFDIEFLRVTHSLVDCFALAITTPVGTIIHTGDYKIDATPVIGEKTDLESLARYGDAGVLALLSDSTNSTVPGRTPSEKDVIPDFEEIFRTAHGRIIVSAFSSSLHRLQIVFDVAQAFGRKVCVLGRSINRNVELADRLGYIEIPDGILINPNELSRYADDEVVLLATGSQGEMRAALWQMATQSYKGIAIEEGDTVILSARIIPGNEHNISQLIGHIYKRGGNIIEEKRRLIHVSGHASQEDIKIMTETVRPRFLIPIHGEYRMLFRHKEYVKNHLNFDEHNIILIENGDMLELDGTRARITERFDVGRTFIAENNYEEIENETIRERKKLAYNGVISLIVTVDGETLEMLDEPEINASGVIGFTDRRDLLNDARAVVATAFNSSLPKERHNTERLKELLRVELKRFVQKQTGAKPLILPAIVEV